MIPIKGEIVNTFSKISITNFSNRKQLLDNLNGLIIEYESTDNFGYLECPHCHSDKLIKYGTYERNIGIYDEFHKIKIKRVLCKECGRTHAIIPSFVIPFYQSERSFLINAINEIVVNNNKVVQTSIEIDISRQKLNSWIKRFKSHLTRLKVSLSYCLNDIIESLLNDVKSVIKYEEMNGIRFMEKVPT